MRKPDSLKQLLIATVPYLAENKEAIALFIDNGQIVGGNGQSLSFEYRYNLNIVLEDYAGSDDAVMVPILAWIAENQPDLIGSPSAKPFTFNAELLDEQTRDLSIVIALTEAVVVTRKQGGGYNVSHPAPPPPRSLDQFEGVPWGAKLWQLFLNDVLAAQTTDPAFHP